MTKRRGDDRGIGREGIMNDEWHGSSGEEMELMMNDMEAQERGWNE